MEINPRGEFSQELKNLIDFVNKTDQVENALYDANVLKVIWMFSQKPIHVVKGALQTVLEEDLTLKSLDKSPMLQDKNILIATGIQCKDSKSHGIPADVIGIFLIAIILSKVLGTRKIIHLIADEHAKL